MSRYEKAHQNPQGPGDARPTALEVVRDEGLLGRLQDKMFLVTGVSNGIGVETLRALYATGAHVFGTVRDLQRGQKVVDEITATTEGGKITLVLMHQDDLSSVKAAAEELLKQTKTLNLIINNAGVMALPYGKTKDGFEQHFGINHLSHFYLFQLLKDTLLASSTPAFPSRVVNVSSYGHRFGKPRLDDWNFTEPGSYDIWHGYAQSKTANIWFSNEIERRFGARGLHSTSLHPGGIKSNLNSHLPSEFQSLWELPQVQKMEKNAAQGAATSIYAALSAEWKNKGGKYLSNCVVQPLWEASKEDSNVMEDVGDERHAAWAYNEEGARRLWDDSMKMVCLS